MASAAAPADAAAAAAKIRTNSNNWHKQKLIKTSEPIREMNQNKKYREYLPYELAHQQK